MKINLLFFVFCIASILTGKNLDAQVLHDWENPDVIGINKEQPRAILFLTGEKAVNPEVVSLNGIWEFMWSPDPQSRPAEFYLEDYATKDWDNIVVPGNWELQGFGTPIYTNINYPFKKDQPRVTSEPPENFTAFKNRNPVGSYCTTFAISLIHISEPTRP